MSDRSHIVGEIKARARELRVDTMQLIWQAGCGHPGGCLSSAEIISVLFFNELRIDPSVPELPDRDRFILSKGHIAPILYAAMKTRGYFHDIPLKKLHHLDSPFQGAPCRLSLPALDASTGSLGQGLSIANGMALAGRLDKLQSRCYVLMGDGEMQCGQVWEAAMTTAHYGLSEVCAIVDFNGLQGEGSVREIKNVEPLRDKWRAFGWNAIEVNGHSVADLLRGFDTARRCNNKPSVIIAMTTKGKGVFFMEHVIDYDGASLTEDQVERAVAGMPMIDN